MLVLWTVLQKSIRQRTFLFSLIKWDGNIVYNVMWPPRICWGFDKTIESPRYWPNKCYVWEPPVTTQPAHLQTSFLIWKRCPFLKQSNLPCWTFLQSNGEIGCVMLGPSCTYATFQLVEWVSTSLHFTCTSKAIFCHVDLLLCACSDEIGLSLSIPVISAGSFGLSCNYKPKLTRILPPARKISDLLVHFVREKLSKVKPVWTKAYIYRKSLEDTSEDCFWWDSRVSCLAQTIAAVTRHAPTLVCNLLPLQVYQFPGGGFCQLCQKHSERDASWWELSVERPQYNKETQQQSVHWNHSFTSLLNMKYGVKGANTSNEV